MFFDDFFFDEAYFFDEIWENYFGRIGEVLAQIIFNFF